MRHDYQLSVLLIDDMPFVNRLCERVMVLGTVSRCSAA